MKAIKWRVEKFQSKKGTDIWKLTIDFKAGINDFTTENIFISADDVNSFQSEIQLNNGKIENKFLVCGSVGYKNNVVYSLKRGVDAGLGLEDVSALFKKL